LNYIYYTYVPIKTEKKKGRIGTPTSGDAMFNSQLGVTGNNLKDNKKNIKLVWLSSNCKINKNNI